MAISSHTHTHTHTEGALEPPLNTFCISRGKLLREDELLMLVMLLPKLMRMRDQRPTSRRRSHIHCSTAELQIALIVRLSSVQFGSVAICRLLGQAAVANGATRSAPALASAAASALGSINPQGIDSTHVGVCWFCWTLVALSFAPG